MNDKDASTQDFQASVLREQVHLALRHLPTMQLASFVVALVLAFSVRQIIPHANIAAWLIMVLAIVASRIAYYYQYSRIRNTSFDGRNWENVYLALALVSGVIWGLSAFIIFPASNIGLISVFVLVIASLSAATTVSHSSLRLGPTAWMAPALLFYAFRCFIAAGETEFTIGILIVIYFLTLLSYSFNHHRVITDSIALRFENLKLLADVQQSEERFRLLFQRHNAVMLLIDPATGGIVDANAAAERFYGFAPGQLTRMNMLDLNLMQPEDSRAACMRAVNEDCNYFMVPHRLADGAIRIVEVHASPIRTGEQTQLFAIIHDITERRRAEERLRESEANYRNLFNSMIDAIYVLDETGRMIDVNKGAEVMYGHPRDFFLGRSPDALAASGMNDLAAVAAAISSALRGEPQLIEFWGMRSGGDVFPQEMRLMPATQGGKHVVIAAARDVSERKRADAERLRTQKLEAIGVLAGGIAHDFNNLLQAVFGYLVVAKRKIDDRAKALLMLEKTEKALQFSVGLTSQLLTFSKGGQPVKQTLALGPIIENVARFTLSGSRSACRFDISDDLWPVEADEGQIGQVIQNIVLNADQAMPRGGTVHVAARNLAQDAAAQPGAPGKGRWIEIVFRDAGVGIPEEILHRIFEPYFTTKQNGSGLGLATSYSIIKNHGGFIDVHSTQGRGSVFTIRLPAVETAVQSVVRAGQGSVLRKGKILVMDDEEGVRDAVGEMLDSLGQDVVFSADGAEAIERYAAALSSGTPFTAVILDATVRGGMGGEEAIKRLKELDPAVVAVIASGHSDNAVTANYLAHGFKAFLHKPFSIDALQNVLATLMQEVATGSAREA